MNYKRNPDGSVEPVEGILEWARWFEGADRTIAFTELGSGVNVSTVFLGVDHGFGIGGGPPVLWETMIFGGPMDLSQWRYSSEAEALTGHNAALHLATEAAGLNLDGSHELH